jgi:putative tryptophan/tyrosine transport system substrate-binding protein
LMLTSARLGVVPFAPKQERVARIGYLGNLPYDSPELGPAFREGLRELGWEEPHNLIMSWRYTNGTEEWVQTAAAELIQVGQDLIVVDSSPPAQAVQSLNSSMPIVLSSHADPVGGGLVTSLARPSGTVTGLSSANVELMPKRAQLLKEGVPSLSRVGIFWNAGAAWTRAFPDVFRTLQELGLDPVSLEVPQPSALDRAFEKGLAQRIDGFITLQNAVIFAGRAEIVEFANRNRLPAIYASRQWTGGLMSYGPNLRVMFHRAAFFADRILRGVKPSELPLELPTVFDFVVNASAVGALGLTIPADVAAQVTDWVR